MIGGRLGLLAADVLQESMFADRVVNMDYKEAIIDEVQHLMPKPQEYIQ